MNRKSLSMLLISIIFIFSSYQVFGSTTIDTAAVKKSEDAIKTTRTQYFKMAIKYPACTISGSVVKRDKKSIQILGSAKLLDPTITNYMAEADMDYIIVGTPNPKLVKNGEYNNGVHYYLAKTNISGIDVSGYGPRPKAFVVAINAYKSAYRVVHKSNNDNITIYEDNTVYEGQLNASNACNGNGTYYNSDGTIQFVGSWINGNWGKGKAKCAFIPVGESEAGIYEGEWASNEPNGNGTYYNSKGVKLYSGTWVNGSPHAKTDPNKYSNGNTTFIGIIKDGLPNGTGKTYSESGVLSGEGKFYGQFIQLTGQGTVYNDWNGSKLYTGSFTSGQYNGQGTLYNDDGSKLYVGSFKYGQYDGQGTLYNDDGSVKYAGKWTNGEQQEQPVIDNSQEAPANDISSDNTYSNYGVKFIGVIKDGVPNGAGKTYDEGNGTLMAEGEFYGEDIQLTGQGTLYNDDGSKLYVGSFLDGQYNGQGTLYNDDGSVKYSGIFTTGTYLGEDPADIPVG